MSQAGLPQATSSPIATTLLQPAKPASQLAKARPAGLISKPNGQQIARPGDVQLTCLL